MKNNFKNSPDLYHISGKSELIKTTNAVLNFLEKEHGGIYFNSDNGKVNFDKYYSFREIYDYLKDLVSSDEEKQNNNLTTKELQRIYYAANQRYNSNNIRIDEALLIMLQVVHSFKCELDNSKDWFEKKQVDSIPVYLPHLLLSILYEINGSSARLCDLDPSWEDEYEKILQLPNYSFELDVSITEFLLLPLYYATHSDSNTVN